MSILYQPTGQKSFFNETIQGKPFVRCLGDKGHPILKIMHIIKNINHPQIVKIYDIHDIDKDTVAVDMEFFVPMIDEYDYYIFNKTELKKIKSAIDELNKHHVILVKLTRLNFGFTNPTQFKFTSFFDAGISALHNPYKWSFKPWYFDLNKKRLRKCDLYSFLSGVYRLTELDKCAFEIFVRANRRRKYLLHSENIELAEDEEIPWAA